MPIRNNKTMLNGWSCRGYNLYLQGEIEARSIAGICNISFVAEGSGLTQP